MLKHGSVVLLTLGSVAMALADTTIYDDEDSFLDAIEGGGGFLLEDFDGYTYGSYTEYTLQLGPENGYAGLVSAEGGDNSYLWSGDGNMSTNSALDWLRVDFNGPEDTYSTAGWFFGTDVSGGFLPGSTIVIELSNGFEYPFVPVSTTDFRGFVTDGPIDWMTIDAPDDRRADRWSTMDHYYIDSPEPASLLLLGVGALLVRRR